MKLHINNDYSFDVYRLMIGIGFLLLIVINLLRYKKYGLKWYSSLILSLLIEALSIVGARILFIIENIGRGASGGFSFYGVILFMPLMIVPFKFLFNNLTWTKFYSYIAVGIPFELAIIKIGCFLCGCCVGIECPWGVSYIDYVPDFYRFPVQLLEAVVDVVIGLGLLLFEKKKLENVNLFVLFIGMYGFTRFFIEFLRFHDITELFCGWLSFGMIWSLVCLSLHVLLTFIEYKHILKKRS